MLVTCLCLVPFIVCLKKFSYTTDATQVFSSDLPSMECLVDMKSDFPPGYLYPFYFVAEPKTENSTVYTQDYFFEVFSRSYFQSLWQSQALIRDILNVSGDRVLDTDIQAISFASGFDIDYEMSILFTNAESPMYNTEYAATYRYLFYSLSNAEYGSVSPSSSYVLVNVAFNPNSDLTDPWIKDMREILHKKYDKDAKFNWYFTNVLVNQYDAAAGVFDKFPVMIGVTCAVVVRLLY